MRDVLTHWTWNASSFIPMRAVKTKHRVGIDEHVDGLVVSNDVRGETPTVRCSTTGTAVPSGRNRFAR